MSISQSKSRPNWETIYEAIHDKCLGITRSYPQPSRASAIRADIVATSGTDNIADISTTSTSDTPNTTTTTKQNKLLSEDKQSIQNMFGNLNEDKMRKLSTETIVEKKMEEFTLSCSHKHPVHSMVLDTDDKHWKKQQLLLDAVGKT
ncbi:hypothetical protein BDF21DRAFT_465746 [Thamnidium elegans]|nr:hypothetical protein BDF21DRAFT_465746 [Thamnidium elegans]